MAGRDVTADRLVRCGAAAGPLFVCVFLVEGARRPAYSPLRHPVSSLAFGPRGWVQVANFALAGTLYVAGAAGLALMPTARGGDRLGAATFAATGIGLLGSALFSTDPVSDYPPGTPDVPAGTLHNLSALPIFLGIPAGALAYAWRFHRRGEHAWALYSAAAGVSVPVAIGLASAGFSQSPHLVDFAGLLQRVAIVTGLGWLTAVSARALAATPRNARCSVGREGSGHRRAPVVVARVVSSRRGTDRPHR